MRMMRKNEWSGENCKKKKKLEIHTTYDTNQMHTYLKKYIKIIVKEGIFILDFKNVVAVMYTICSGLHF